MCVCVCVCACVEGSGRGLLGGHDVQLLLQPDLGGLEVFDPLPGLAQLLLELGYLLLQLALLLLQLLPTLPGGGEL